MRRILFLLTILFLAVSCEFDDKIKEQRSVVLIYAACHNNGLSSYISRQLEEIQDGGTIPESSDNKNIFLVYSHMPGSDPVLSRYSIDRNGNFVNSIIKTYPAGTISLRTQQINAVLNDAQNAFPSKHVVLSMSTHGSSFLPATKSAQSLKAEIPMVESLGPDDNVEINIDDFAKSLAFFHFDCIMMDCCYMAGVEPCYELKNITDYIIGSTTEVMANGMFISSMVPHLLDKDHRETSLTEACKAFMSRVRTDKAYSSSGLVSLIKTSQMPALAETSKRIFSAHRTEISRINPAKIQKYLGLADYRCLYDLGDFVENISSEEEFSAFQTALDRVVIFKDATPQFLGHTVKKHSGLSVYLPESRDANVDQYYRTTAWNMATGLVE